MKFSKDQPSFWTSSSMRPATSPAVRAALQLDVQNGPAIDRGADLAQRGNPLAAACIQRAQVLERLTCEIAATIRGALQPGIVEDEEFAADVPHVHFDALRAELQGSAHGANGILRLVSARAAMPEANHAGSCVVPAGISPSRCSITI